MGLWTKFKDFADRVGKEEQPARNLREEELRLAAAALLVRASAIDGQVDAVDLYRFTSVLCRELDQDGRKRVVEMLWEVVLADGVVDEFETNLVWRVAELIGVSTRDRVTLRKMVEARALG